MRDVCHGLLTLHLDVTDGLCFGIVTLSRSCILFFNDHKKKKKKKKKTTTEIINMYKVNININMFKHIFF